MLTLLFLPACTGFTGVLDAHFEPTEEDTHAGVGGATERGQTLTVEGSGRLRKLDIWLKGATQTAPLLVSLVSLDPDGAPDTEDGVLAEVRIEGGKVAEEPVWHSVDLRDARVDVSAGDALAWVVRSPAEDDWNYGLLGAWENESGETYGAGGMCDRVVDNYDWDPCGGDMDYGFRLWREPDE